MRAKFSSEYLSVRYAYCNKTLAVLPLVTTGAHNGFPVVRVRRSTNNGHYKWEEHRLNTAKANNAKKYEAFRQSLISEIEELKRTQGFDPSLRLKIRSSKDLFMNGEYYKRLVGEQNTQQNNSMYYHKGIHVRSRAEMLVAEVLDELRLQYKYEPAVTINDVTFYPDFVVYIEAIDACFVIEVLGKTDNYEYMNNNVSKLVKYSVAGISINDNLLLIPGTVSYMPDTDHIYNSIVNMVNLAAWDAILA